jgi:transposase InsO family protein
MIRICCRTSSSNTTANGYLIAYIPAASLHTEATTDNVLETLQQALSNGRTPRQILSDHGMQYWSSGGPSRFTDFCATHGIEHILGSTGKPTKQGKIERFFQTFTAYYPRFNDMTEFLEHYNHVKRHRSLNFLTPAEVYYAGLYKRSLYPAHRFFREWNQPSQRRA